MVQISTNKKKNIIKRIKKCWPLYIFLLLPVMYLIIFLYYPMYGAQIAFKDFRAGLGIFQSPWVGMKHFVRFFNNYQFWRIVRNTIVLSVYTLLASFPIRIILALSLNAVRNMGFKKTVQMTTYMPHFISTVVVVGMMMQFLNPRMGIISLAIQSLGGSSRDLLGVASAFPHLYVWSDVWKTAGYGTIIFLAALASVDPFLHQAALIDGATRWQRIIHVDFPALLPVVTIVLIMQFGRIMNVGFEKVYLMQNDLNLKTSEIITTFVYKVGIGGGANTQRTDYSYGSAIGLFNSVISFILVMSVNKIAKVLNQTSLW